MENYFKIKAINIINWLKDNQITENSIFDEKINKYFSENQIKNMIGGIFDPVSKKVLGDHYSTSFYFLAYILLNQTNSTLSISDASLNQAYDFVKKYTFRFPYGDWQMHRDFNNLALSIAGYVLEKENSFNNKINIRHLFPQRNNTGNWVGMKSVTFTINKKKYKFSVYNKVLSKYYTRKFLKYLDNEGCFHDVINDSYPIQYHAYSTVLLYLLYHFSENEEYKRLFIKSTDYLLSFMSFQGDFNYVGRGHKQIFGYASFYFVMNAAFHITKNLKYLKYLSHNINYLKKMNFSSYHLSLLQNGLPDLRENGWFDYHHTSVYNSFFAAIVLFSDYLFDDNLTNTKLEKINYYELYKPKISFLQTSIVLRNEFWMLQFGRAGEKYISDISFTPNLISNNKEELFSSPIGPTSERYGKQFKYQNEAKRNLFSPLIGESKLTWPYNTRMYYKLNGNKLIIESKNDLFYVKREVLLEGNELTFIDEIKIFSQRINVIPFNLSLNKDNIIQIKKNYIKTNSCVIRIKGIENFKHISDFGHFASGNMDLFYSKSMDKKQFKIISKFEMLINNED